jgi:hypothetical protein
MTPHQRRVRELEALRHVIAACEPHTKSATVPTRVLAEIFEGHTSGLPADSQVLAQFRSLASRLRQERSPQIAGSNVRQVVVTLRRKADDLARWVEGRDARLAERR